MTEKQKERLLGWFLGLMTLAIVGVAKWADSISTDVGHTQTDLVLEKDRSKRVDASYEKDKTSIRRRVNKNEEDIDEVDKKIDRVFHNLDKRLALIKKDIEHLHQSKEPF